MIGTRNESTKVKEALDALDLNVDRRTILAERGLIHTADTEDLLAVPSVSARFITTTI